MSPMATDSASQPVAASTLIVVFPSLAMQPDAMMACIAGFDGGKFVVINDANAPADDMPRLLGRHLERQAGRGKLVTMPMQMFGNRRGLILPVDLAVQIISSADLAAEKDHLLLTGCYRGWLPGSIDVLADALAAVHFKVSVDAGIMRR